MGSRLARLIVPASPSQSIDGLDRTDRYEDPVGHLAPEEFGGTWLAAFAPIGDTGWIAVVQERRQPVIEPVEGLRDRLVHTGVLGIFIIIGLVMGCWSLLIWLMNDRKSIGWRRFLWHPHHPSPSTVDPGSRNSESA